MPPLLKPARLEPGQTIGVCCPASAPPDPDAIDRPLAVLAGLGYQNRLAPHARDRHGFLAGSDRDRAGDLMRLFRDRRVDAIFCVRGGYGCTRLLDRLDYPVMRAHPKILLGYSDITALHCALLKKAGLVSFHGPVLNSDFLRDPLNQFTLASLWRTLTLAKPAGSLGGALHPLARAPRECAEASGARTFLSASAAPEVPEADKNVRAPLGGCPAKLPEPPSGQGGPTSLSSGCATGRLVGGNLSLLCALVGTPWLPSLRGRILFFEDVDEAPYRLDRMLTHLLSAGALRGVAGIAIGTNVACDDPKRDQFQEYRQTATDVLRERLVPLGVPIVCGLPFGHQAVNATLPVGVRAELDARRGDLRILESAVR